MTSRPMGWLLAVVLAVSVAAAAAAGCGFNCGKCGQYKLFGKKNCRSCCWGDPIEEMKETTKKVGCELVVVAGGRGYVAAAGLMANRASSPAEKFTDDEKAILQPCYGDLVDVANLYFGVPPVDHINFAGINWKNEGAEAQTFGGSIYFKEQRPDVPIETMKHEMMHVKQWDRHARDLGLMGEKYMRGWCDAGYSYSRNSYEEEATAAETNCNI